MPITAAATTQQGKPLVCFDKVTFRYPTQIQPTLKAVSFSISAGEIVTLLGPNGGGKTTCLMLISGKLNPTMGNINIAGLTPAMLPSRYINGVLQQPAAYGHGTPIPFPLCLGEYVALGCVGGVIQTERSQPSSPIRSAQPVLPSLKQQVRQFVQNIRTAMPARRERIHKALLRVGMEALTAVPLITLSAGQRQRAAIARALISNAPILLFDEPTANLDEESEAHFYKLLQELRAEGKTILIVSHDTNAAPKFSNQLLCVKQSVHTISKTAFTNNALAKLYPQTIAMLNHSHYHD